MTTREPVTSVAGAVPEIETVEPHYPALVGLARHGGAIAKLAGVTAFVAVAAPCYPLLGTPGLLIAVVVAAVVFGLAAVLADIARLLVDTLVPK